MNSDTYEFSKSSVPQSVDAYSPYSDKQFNFVQDINGGVYQNSGLSLVQWDLSSIYNSGAMADTADMYLTIPTIMCAQFNNGATGAVAPVNGSSALLTMKSNTQHLVHQIEIVCNGKVINDMQPFLSVYKNFKLLSSMSASDLKAIAPSLGMSDVLDSEKSVVWNPIPVTGAIPSSGVGLSNNRPFPASGSGTDCQSLMASSQNTGACNTAIQKRTSRLVDQTQAQGSATVASTSAQGIYGPATTALATNIMTSSQLTAEFKPYYTVNGNQMIWYDYAVLPLKYLCDCLDKIGLTKKLDIVIRAYFNTGSIVVPVLNPNTTNLSYGAFLGSTFGATCPFTVNWLAGVSTAGGIPATTTQIVAGLYIGKSPSTSLGLLATNFSGYTSSMGACRCYYSLVKLEPQRAQEYITENREKRVVYENVIFNQYNNITSGGTFSQLVQSGIKNPRGICIVPMISTYALTTVGSATTIGTTQYGSPYDTFPATYAPLSLTNLAVSLGGQQVLNTSLFYTYENYLQQVSLMESLTSSDIGISTGLITAPWWEGNRCYWVDLGRGRDADKSTLRNINISFTNNSAIPIDIMVFTVYLDEIQVDCETGQCKRL